MIMPIYLYGTKVFDEPVHRITQFNDKLIGVIRDMFETLVNGDGIGLAANQTGLPVSLFVMDLSRLNDHPDERPVAVINPDILSWSDNSVTMQEGCLSIPGIHEEVIRPDSILVRFTDGNFQPVERELSGYSARVFQHEYDHLHRKFFVDRLSSVKRQFIKPKLSKIRKGETSAKYPVLSQAEERKSRQVRMVKYEF